ncbi:MAG: hypothetical protein WC314_19610 [Vulcanimicrobiota bacterium]
MRKILAAVVLLTLMGAPVVAQNCCADKQQAQAQTQTAETKQCCKDKAAKGESAKKECCADKAKQAKAQKDNCCEKEAAKACQGCDKSADTWMTAPAECKKECKATS